MITITQLLTTIYFWSLSVVGVLASTVVCLMAYPFVQQKTFSRLYEIVAGYIILYGMTIPGIWSLKITDLRKNKSFEENYIIIANHVSFIDSLIAVVLPFKKKFMIGKIFTKIPVFGWLSIISGHVPVDNKDKSTTIDAVDRAVKSIQLDNSSFMMYPEGKRSKNAFKLLPFKSGAYRIAQRTGLTILPVTLKGTNVGMKFGAICSPASMEMVIGEPFKVKPGWDNVSKAITHSRVIIQQNMTKP